MLKMNNVNLSLHKTTNMIANEVVICTKNIGIDKQTFRHKSVTTYLPISILMYVLATEGIFKCTKHITSYKMNKKLKCFGIFIIRPNYFYLVYFIFTTIVIYSHIRSCISVA